MSRSARICIGAGGLALLVSVANQLTAPELNPALERSSVLASLLSVGGTRTTCHHFLECHFDVLFMIDSASQLLI
jgi:hypothetical protein